VSATKRGIGASFFALVGLLVLASSALAAPPQVVVRNDRITGDFTDSDTCAGVTLLTEFEIKRSRTFYLAADGTPSREVVHAIYRITWTNIDQPDLVVRSPGTRHVVFDYEAGTFTDTGVYRNATAPGEGTVLLQAGRLVETLHFDGTYLALNGPHEDLAGELGDFCAALGA
jgi:hypothetical protein